MSGQKKILLIEDNQDVRENTAEILELANYHVWTANNGKEGVALAKKHLPDLIICDIMMPELDGYGVLHILSHDPKTTVIPFVFLTAKTEKSDFRKGMNLGADDYITKPFEEIDLLDTINRRLEKIELLSHKNEEDASVVSSSLLNSQSVEKALKQLIEGQKILKIAAKYVLFYEDSYPNYLYFIQKGKVKSYQTNQEGKELIVNLYQEGDYFGYIALLGNDQYTDSAMSMEDSEIVLIPKDAFLNLLYTDQQVNTFFLHLLVNRIRKQEKRLLQQSYDSVRMRTAQILLLMCEGEAKRSETPSKRISIEVLREDLANWVGTSKETLIRTLSDFKQEGLIVSKGRYITVLDQKLLEKIGSGNGC